MARKITSKTNFSFEQLMQMKKVTKTGKTTYGEFRKVVNSMGSDRIIKTFGGDHLNKLNEQQMRIVLNRLNTNANQRIKKLEDFKNKEGFNFDSPAMSILKNSGKTRFDMAGSLTRNAMYKKMKPLFNFLNAKTSTVKGWKNQLKGFKKATGFNYDDEDQRETWEEMQSVFNMYNEQWQEMVRTVGSETVRKIISEVTQANPNLSKEEILEIVVERVRALYEEIKQSEYPFEETSGFTF